jgi:SnoaL-like domain
MQYLDAIHAIERRSALTQPLYRAQCMHMTDARAQIMNLMNLYAHRFDDADFEGFAALFAHGALHLGVVAPMAGAEEVLGFIRERVILYDGSPRTNHLIHNPVIEVADGGREATARSYVQILQGVPGRPIETIGTGRYHDRFVQTAGEWRFEERVGLGSLRGDFSHHLRPAVVTPEPAQ